MIRLVVLGGGESGTGAALLAKQQGMDVFVSDTGIIQADYKHLLTTYQIPFEEGGHTIETIQSADEVIKSPGIPYEATIIKGLHDIPIIDEIEFAARYAKGKIIAVTGSNGKSTTAYLIYHLLNAAGCPVALAGNIGYSFAKCLTQSSYDYYVLELSSFQLEGIKHFKPDIACLLNITPDHLDRYHYSIEAYAKAKLNILRNMTPLDHFIYDTSDPITTQYLQAQKSLPQLHPIRPLAKPICGEQFLGEAQSSTAEYSGVFEEHRQAPKLPFSNRFCKRSIDRYANGLFHLNKSSDSFAISQEQLPLLGSHNQYNAMVAVKAAALAGLPPEAIAAALPKFCGLPHRLEWCGTLQGIDCYNDSKSTNIASTTAALLSFSRPIIWIAGGIDKGNDYSPLLPIVGDRVKAIVCLGKENNAIVQAFRPLGLPIQETNNLSTAIDSALAIALPGEVVLLSPACASFDLFKNFEDRGNQFKEKISERIQK